MPYKDPEAKRANDAAYRAAHREETRAYHAAYRGAHREDIRAYQAAYRGVHRAEARLKRAVYYDAHRKEDMARSAANYAAHREEYLAHDRVYRAAHRAEARARKAAYKVAHPEYSSAMTGRRRARKRNAPVNDFTAAQWRELQAAYDHCCAYCRKRAKGHLTQDHITPLSKGGSHTLSNIVPACRSCNSRKGTRPVLVPVQPLLLTVAPSTKRKA